MFELDGFTLRSEDLDRYVPESRSYEPFALELPESLPEGGISALFEEVLAAEPLRGHLVKLAQDHSPDFYGAHNWGTPVKFEPRQYSELLERSDEAWQRWVSAEYRQAYTSAGQPLPPFRQELDWSLREWFDVNFEARDALSRASWRAWSEGWAESFVASFAEAATSLWGLGEEEVAESLQMAITAELEAEMERADTDGPLDLLDTCEYGLLYAPPGSSEPCGLTRERFDWGTFVAPGDELAATLTFLRISRDEFVKEVAAWNASEPDAHSRIAATYASLQVDSEAFAGEALLSAGEFVELLIDALSGSSMVQPVVAVRAKFGPLLSRDRSEEAPALVISGQKLLVLHDFSNGAGVETALENQIELSPRAGQWFIDEGRRHGIQAVYDLATSSWRGRLTQTATITAEDLPGAPPLRLLPSAVRLEPAARSRFYHRGLGEAVAVALSAAGMASHAASLRSAVSASENWQQTLRLCSEHGVALCVK